MSGGSPACHYPDTEPRSAHSLPGLAKRQETGPRAPKSTELGATRLCRCWPRDLSRRSGQAGGGRLERWRRIVQEAAEQSGRARLPEVSDIVTLDRAIQDIDAGDLCLVGALDDNVPGIRDVLESHHLPAAVRIFVGPEGGFDDDELALLRSGRVVSVSLGRRILRTETAGLAMLTVVGYALGEMSTKGADASL